MSHTRAQQDSQERETRQVKSRPPRWTGYWGRLGLLGVLGLFWLGRVSAQAATPRVQPASTAVQQGQDVALYITGRVGCSSLAPRMGHRVGDQRISAMGP